MAVVLVAVFLAAGLAAALVVAFLAAGLAAGFAAALAAVFLVAVFFAEAVLFSAALVVAFLVDALVVVLAAAFFVVVFLVAAFLVVDFLAVVFLAAFLGSGPAYFRTTPPRGGILILKDWSRMFQGTSSVSKVTPSLVTPEPPNSMASELKPSTQRPALGRPMRNSSWGLTSKLRMTTTSSAGSSP